MATGLIGYTDRLGVTAGETIGVRCSSPVQAEARLRLRRVTGWRWTEAGGEAQFEDVPEAAVVTASLAPRRIPLGSFSVAPAPGGLAAGFAMGLWAQPWSKSGARASLFALEGQGDTVAIGFSASGCPCLTRGGAEVLTLSASVPRQVWVPIAVEIAEGAVTLLARIGEETHRASAALTADFGAIRSVRFAGADDGAGHVKNLFDGRLEAPTLARTTGPRLLAALEAGRAGISALGPRLLAAWDFARWIDGQTIHDSGPARLHGTLVNRPARAVTGAFWSGAVFDWRQAPGEYAAIHFHGDDLDDCGWREDARIAIPENARPGLYTVEVEAGGARDHLPFAVRAPKGEGPRLAVLLPTFTYLSYANARGPMRGPDFGVTGYAGEARLAAQEVGRSQYDLHDDRSPVMFSSPRRPLLSMRLDVKPWGLPVDAALIGYLEHLGQDYDVLTDADLHREGVRALERYGCVLTGNHPEYYSAEMRAGIEAFTYRGGRLMYLGGNGFYWRVSVDEEAGAIEVRRAEDGTRAWIAAPGEAHHAMDGGYGGLWRRLGASPNRLVDVGFAAQGDFEVSGHYVLRDGVRGGLAGFALEGVSGEAIGAHGWLGGGAAGQEIDRADPALGTHPDTVIVASSTGHRPAMMRTIEEMLSSVPPFADPKARADVTFRAIQGGGAIFSVGSMTWIAALDHAGFDNDIARVTGNVLRRFLDPAPFEGAP